MSKKAQLKTAMQRIAELRAEMRSIKVDAFVVSYSSSLRYLFGFSGSTGMALVTARKVYFVTNDLYQVQVKKELLPIPGLDVHIDRDPWNAISSRGIADKWKRVGFDPSKHSVLALKSMKKGLGKAKLVESANTVDLITRAKSKQEIKSIASAAQIASTAYEKLLGVIKPGMTELQVANFLASTTRDLGSERDAFDIIVVAGARSAMPHGRASTNVLKQGDVVTVDFGCCVNGFHSDMTRTFCIGTPKKSVMEVFSVLYEAHMSALDAVVSGIKASDLDKAARSVVENAGYGEYFRHSLGHGLGYDVHELPRVSAMNNQETIPEGCVVTIEPGIYLPGKFGMRIEDDVVVTSTGAQILTTAPRELVIV